MKIVLLAIAILVFPFSAQAEELVIATTTYCPLVCVGNEAGQDGIMHEVLRAAFDNSEYKLKFENMPYGRAIQGTLDGHYAAVTFAGTANSPDFLFVRNFVMTNIVQFAVLKESTWKYTGVPSLHDIRLGIPTGFRTGNTEIDDYISNPPESHHVFFSSSDNPTTAQTANLKRLLAGRLDAMLCGSLAFKYIAHNMGVADRLRLDPTPVASFYNHISFSPKHPNGKTLRKFVERKIDDMQRSGRLTRILRRYGIKQ